MTPMSLCRVLSATLCLLALIGAGGCERTPPPPAAGMAKTPSAAAVVPAAAASTVGSEAAALLSADSAVPPTPVVAIVSAAAPDGALPVASPAVIDASATAIEAASPLADGPAYLCAEGGTSVPIDMETRLESLCRRHPEMGPCRYARNTCRAHGGSVTNGAGVAVTAATEAAYDRRVMRLTLSADGASAPKKR